MQTRCTGRTELVAKLTDHVRDPKPEWISDHRQGVENLSHCLLKSQLLGLNTVSRMNGLLQQAKTVARLQDGGATSSPSANRPSTRKASVIPYPLGRPDCLRLKQVCQMGLAPTSKAPPLHAHRELRRSTRAAKVIKNAQARQLFHSKRSRTPTTATQTKPNAPKSGIVLG